MPIFFRGDINFPIYEAYFYLLNARLAPEVLFHPVGSKVSSHTFDAHFNMFDLRLSGQRAEQNEQRDFVLVHCSSFLKMHSKLLRNSETDVTADRHELSARGMDYIPVHSEPSVHAGAEAYVGRESD